MVDKVMQDLADKGQIIEGGWAGLRLMAINPDAPPVQLDVMRMAFFAGAHHLYSSILAILDPGAEVTERDLEMMAKIRAELDEFGDQLELEIKTEGNA